MHSCVTRKPPRGVRAHWPGVRADTDDAKRRSGRAGHETGDREHAGALEIQRRDSREHEEEPRCKEHESARRLRALAGNRADRDRCFGPCLSTIREAHPPKHISGDRECEHSRPDVDVQGAEPHRRRGHPSESADPQGVETEDQPRAAGSPREAHPPLCRVGEDGPEAQCQRVGTAARKRDVDGQDRCAEQPRGEPRLYSGERQHHVRLSPVQTEQAEEAEAPQHGPQRELKRRHSTEGRVRRHGGSPAP